MKSMIRAVVLGVVLLVALAACGPSSLASTTKATSSDPIVPSEGQLKSQGMYPAPDLSLVANTGRPQLLNGYANW